MPADVPPPTTDATAEGPTNVNPPTDGTPTDGTPTDGTPTDANIHMTPLSDHSYFVKKPRISNIKSNSQTNSCSPCKTVKCNDKLNKMYSVISTGQWLQDNEMDHAQGLLHQQYPDVDGLQSVLVFEAAKHIGTPSRPFVQTLLLKGNHWICVSNIGCESNKVLVYDSASPKAATPKLKKQLARLINTEKSKFVIEWPDFQV
jgi:hypothetical protein